MGHKGPVIYGLGASGSSGLEPNRNQSINQTFKNLKTVAFVDLIPRIFDRQISMSWRYIIKMEEVHSQKKRIHHSYQCVNVRISNHTFMILFLSDTERSLRIGSNSGVTSSSESPSSGYSVSFVPLFSLLANFFPRLFSRFTGVNQTGSRGKSHSVKLIC